MAFDRISDSRMYEEIMEVVSDLPLKDKDIDFLENIEDSAKADNLSDGRRQWLEDIYRKACNMSEGHHG